jgi:hypothetical protein
MAIIVVLSVAVAEYTGATVTNGRQGGDDGVTIACARRARAS